MFYSIIPPNRFSSYAPVLAETAPSPPDFAADDISTDDAAGFFKFAVAAGESRVRIKLNCDAAASAPRRFYVGCSIAIRAPRARCLLASRQLSFRRADLLAGESVA